jgi:hypothetical protein
MLSHEIHRVVVSIGRDYTAIKAQERLRLNECILRTKAVKVPKHMDVDRQCFKDSRFCKSLSLRFCSVKV